MLPIENYSPLMKFLNAFIYGFSLSSEWKRISSLNLACSIKMGNAKNVAFTFLCFSHAMETP